MNAGDVLMSSCVSFVDDLSSIIGEDTEGWTLPEISVKKSPGHESVMSVDSGLSLGSPQGSELSGGDEMLPNWDRLALNLGDMLSEDADQDLIQYMRSDSRSENEALVQDTSESVDIGPADVSEDMEALLAQVEAKDRIIVQNPTEPKLKMSLRSATRGPSCTNSKMQPSAETPTVSRVRSHKKNNQESTDDPECVGFNDKNTRNAIQARINRQRKKEYISKLESSVAALTDENNQLKKESLEMTKERDYLNEEVAYLKSVLLNQSALAGVLKNIDNIGGSGVRVTSSFAASRKRRAAELDHAYGESSATKKSCASAGGSRMSGGVCLHVDDKTVSLEFCSKCSQMATGAARDTP